MLPTITWRAPREAAPERVERGPWLARLTLLLGGFVVLLVALVLAAPTWYRQHVWRECRTELERRFGQDYAILAVHSQGEDTTSFDPWPSLAAWWREERNGHYHFAVLVGDNRSAHIFYWSIREDRWVRDYHYQLAWRSPAQRAALSYHPQGRGRLHGMWCRLPLLTGTGWY